MPELPGFNLVLRTLFLPEHKHHYALKKERKIFVSLSKVRFSVFPINNDSKLIDSREQGLRLLMMQRYIRYVAVYKNKGKEFVTLQSVLSLTPALALSIIAS